MQLAHAGRKASCRVPWEGGQFIPVAEGGWLPHAPSAVPFRDGDAIPLALDAAGLDRVRRAFVNAAMRAARLGIRCARDSFGARLSAARIPVAALQPARR
jgi:2,4-dienoyl-CoA reductase-like NADH-dependent reductase (Old Yellow Enzyme family)